MTLIFSIKLFELGVESTKERTKGKNDMVREPYTQWVLERVLVVKLPFDIDPEYKPDVPDPLPMSV